MKKLLFTAAMLIASNSLFSQTKFGIKGGINLATMELKEEGSSTSQNSSSRLSFNLTGFADIPLSETFSFQPGLGISGKGYTAEQTMDMFGMDLKFEETADLMYLEVPMNAVAKFNAGTGKFFVGAGPYLGYALSGKKKFKQSGADEDGNNISEEEEEDIEFGSGEDKLKALDLGLNFLAGYELASGISLNAGYGLGLSNLAHKDSGATLKNRVLSISVGFSF